MEEINSTEKKRSKVKSFFSWLLLILALGFAGVIYFKYYFVFGEGVKSGYLYYAIRKSTLFKMYEGILIQEGFGSGRTWSIASNEFVFSVENDSIFRLLEAISGKFFDLHYKEYHGVLPWRGHTKHNV